MTRIQAIFAANMRHYRKRAKMTQEELAERCGLHRTYIGGIEQQRINVSLKNIEKIAAALQIDPVLLFTKASEDSPGAFHQKDLQQSTQDNPSCPNTESYALCHQTDDGITIQPLNVHDENLTISILCALVNGGHKGDLADAYDTAEKEILELLREAYPAMMPARQPGNDKNRG